MKKLLILLTSALLLFVTGCDTASEAILLEITEEYQTLQDEYDLLKDKVDELEILVQENQTTQDDNLEVEKTELESEITDLSAVVVSIQAEIDIVTATLLSLNTTVDTINDITLSIEQIESSLVSINEVIVLLSSSSLPDDFDQLKVDLELLVSEIEFKLTSLRNSDMIGYTLTNEIISEYLFNMNNLYTTLLPSDSINPIASDVLVNCDALTYDLCVSKDSMPKVYTTTYMAFLDKISTINDMQKYLIEFDEFINGFEDSYIPVFLEEENIYANGKVKHVERDTNRVIYEFTFDTTMDSVDLMIDVQFIMEMTSVEPYPEPTNRQNAPGPTLPDMMISLLFDIKNATTLETIDTIRYSFTEGYNYSKFDIQQTDVLTNSMYSFAKKGDVNVVEYFTYTELESYEYMQGSYTNDGSVYLVYGKEDFTVPVAPSKLRNSIQNFRGNDLTTDDTLNSTTQVPIIMAADVINTNSVYIREVYANNTLLHVTSSVFEEIPLFWFNNWENAYFKKAVDTEPSDISKIIYTDLTEMNIDDTTSEYGSKIIQPEYFYFNGTEIVPMDNYLAAYLYKGSAEHLGLTFSTEFDNQMTLIANLHLQYALSDSSFGLQTTFDINSFTYGEPNTQTPTKTQQEVFDDAQRLYELINIFYKDLYIGNIYYADIDGLLVGFDESYYNLDNDIAYIDNGTVYLLLRAKYMGDYQCYYVNMETATLEDVTIKNK